MENMRHFTNLTQDIGLFEDLHGAMVISHSPALLSESLKNPEADHGKLML